ncbi:ROK family transcriptional regulator [Halocynthiibacter namhaensis]|uniref:ROK family transcriptional regulator n=1 Tax=Halocynthiibacter namhaensis TaxID=1290553 RepID=UPI00068B2B6D|nr:ROK family transcriptional regulator [Halocynthiibacter namhaensis]
MKPISKDKFERRSNAGKASSSSTGNSTGTGANSERARQHNRKLVLSALQDAYAGNGTAGRAEIARLSGLSTQAVSNIIADLEARGLIRACGRRSVGRGQPAIQYEINPDGAYALGFEVRPDAVFCTLINLHGKAVFWDRNPLQQATPQNVAQEMLTLKSEALGIRNLSANMILGVGLVMPGPFGITGITGHQSDLPEWQDIDVRDWAQELLDLPCLVENDANAAAMAERISGAARGLRDYACLYFGAGIGLGIVNDTQILRGAFGNAGEIGHIRIPMPSGPARLEQVLSRISVQKHLKINDISAQTTEALEAHFQSETPALMAWIDQARLALAEATNLIENLYDPETIVLCGAMPAVIFAALVQDLSLSPHSVSVRPDRTIDRVVQGSSGPMTAALGSAALVLNDEFTPKFMGSS